MMFLSKLVANFVYTDFINSISNTLLQIPVNLLCCNATFCALYFMTKLLKPKNTYEFLEVNLK